MGKAFKRWLKKYGGASFSFLGNGFKQWLKM